MLEEKARLWNSESLSVIKLFLGQEKFRKMLAVDPKVNL